MSQIPFKPNPSIGERIAAYVAAVPGAISGQDGHGQTFKLACTLYNGWALSEDEVLRWLWVYNERCEPPWSEKELRHKASEAAKATHLKPWGHLLGYVAEPPPIRLPGQELIGRKIRVEGLSTDATDDSEFQNCATLATNKSLLSISEKQPATLATDKKPQSKPQSALKNSLSEMLSGLFPVANVANHPQASVSSPNSQTSVPSQTSVANVPSSPKAEEEWGQGRDDKKEIYVPTEEERVPEPPGHLRRKDRMQWYEEESRRAIGEEYCFASDEEAYEDWRQRCKPRRKPQSPAGSNSQSPRGSKAQPPISIADRLSAAKAQEEFAL